MCRSLAHVAVCLLSLWRAQLLELRSSQAYVDQKREGLKCISEGSPSKALKVFLAGRMPAVADVEPPPNPLLIFHTLLFDAALEAWTVDPDLHPLQALRAHIPAYLGEVATACMRGGPWRCRLTDFVASLATPKLWKAEGTRPDVENNVWRVVLATKYGEDAHHGFTMGLVPADALYSDAYRLYAVREIFIALWRAIGVLDLAGSPDKPRSPADVVDEAIDRQAVHGLIPELRAGVCESTFAMIGGVIGEYGTVLHEARTSRDATTPFPTMLVVYPSDSMSQWAKQSVVYENLAMRRREESLAIVASKGQQGVALTFPPPGLAYSAPSGPSGAAASADVASLAAALSKLTPAEVAIQLGQLGHGAPPASAGLGKLRLKGDRWERAGSRVAYSDSSLDAKLQDLEVDPVTVCKPWLITQAAQGSTAEECWRDCPHSGAHKVDSSFHRVIPRLKLSECRVATGGGRKGADGGGAGAKRPWPGQKAT